MRAGPVTPPFDEALAMVSADQLGPLVSSVAARRVFGIRPMPDAPPTWLLDPAPDDVPDACKLWRVGDDRIHVAPRAALHDALRVRLRDALSPYEGQASVPPWVAIARLADVELRATASPG